MPGIFREGVAFAGEGDERVRDVERFECVLEQDVFEKRDANVGIAGDHVGGGGDLVHLEERGLASGAINVRMAAVRRLAYEAADSGLLSPELAARIHRIKGVRKLGSRLGNSRSRQSAMDQTT